MVTDFLLDEFNYEKTAKTLGRLCHVEFLFKFFDEMTNKRGCLKIIDL